MCNARAVNGHGFKKWHGYKKSLVEKVVYEFANKFINLKKNEIK
jgi:hypothetical protein